MSELTASDFCRAFLSELVRGGERVLQPKSASQRRGFSKIIEVINAAADGARRGNRTWYKQLVRLRNSLQPSNNGAFETLESILRDLQTSSVIHPNPRYELLEIEVSNSFANNVLSKLDQRTRTLVTTAAREFKEAQQESAKLIENN